MFNNCVFLNPSLPLRSDALMFLLRSISAFKRYHALDALRSVEAETVNT
jgi:hypothetical protein